MDEREVRRRAHEMRPVFIVGAPRSGSSLLYRTLQRHPSFACPAADDGLDLQESDIVAHLPNLPWFNRDQPRSLNRFMLGDLRRIDAFLHVTKPLRQRASRLHERNGEVTPIDARRFGRRRIAYDRVVQAYFVLASDARGCRRLVEKTPHHVEHLDLFRDAFPLARFLHIHRHPVDVYSSYRRRAAVDANAAWARLSPDEFVALYRRFTEAALREADDRRGDLLLVSYERFVRDPRPTWAQICAFLDEPVDESALTVDQPDPDRWRVDPHLFGDITTRTKDWRDHLSPDDAATVETALADVMSRLGYERYTELTSS